MSVTPRRATGPVAVVAALLLAGCSGGSDGDDVTAPPPSRSPSGPASGSTSTSPSASASASASASGTSSASVPASGPPSASVTLTPPAVPTFPSTYRGAFTLASGGGSVTGYLTSIVCAPDGSMTADQLSLAPGATSVTLTTQPTPLGPVTVTGSAELDAAGGTFRGADADQAVTVVWTC